MRNLNTVHNKRENGKVRYEMPKSMDDAKNVCEEKKGRMGVR